MSYDSRSIVNENDNDNYNFTVTYEHHEGYLEFTFRYISSTFTYIRKLRVNLEAQYQHDRQALIGLNQRFGLFLDRVHLLEAENIRYTIQIADFRRSSSSSGIDLQWSKRYSDLQSDYSMIGETKVDYEYDLEVFQLQIGMYQKLIDIQQQWKGASRSKLEQELKQSTDELTTLRASYANLEREITGLYAARKDTLKQYENVTRDWCLMKKQQKKRNISIQILKSQIACYKTLRAHSAQHLQSLSVEQIDVKQFWSFELDKCVTKIRRDFELLYAAIYRGMNEHYQKKMEETEINVKRAVHYQEQMMKEMGSNQETLKVECDEVQNTLSHEKQVQIELEAKCAKLESELKSIQLHHQKQFEQQLEEIHHAQERITMVAYNIDEIRRSTKSLEAEIIIYRHLLECSEIGERVVIAHRPQPVRTETRNELIVENESKRTGSVGIIECATNGRYITLKNHSMINNIDISRWVIERRIGSGTQVRHRLPGEIRLQPGKELTIYSKLAVGTTESSSDHRFISSSIHEGIVCNDLASWGIGDRARTVLLDQNDQLRASFTQSVILETSKN